MDAAIVSYECVMQHVCQFPAAKLRAVVEDVSLNPIEMELDLSPFSCFKLLV